MIRAVTFDLDGTLIDSTEAIVASFHHTFDAIGEPHPPRERLVGTIGHIL
jgi:phosphoglycolate phosphatase